MGGTPSHFILIYPIIAYEFYFKFYIMKKKAKKELQQN